MVAETATRPIRATPRRRLVLPRWPRLLGAIIVGAVVAAGADGLTSDVVYRARAVVGLEDVTSGVAVDPASVASTLVLTRQILTRAAVALRDQGIAAARPGLAERVAVAADLTAASSQDDRLSRTLASSVLIAQDRGAEDIGVLASDEKAERAAAIATRVAEAFVAEKNDTIALARHKADGAAALRLQTLTDAVEAARRRLATFGAGVDPAQTRNEASNAAASAKARYDAFRLVMASGTPPLGAAAGLPPTIVPLQTAYLDLKRQLSDAQRTLGDRHTTVIGLVDGLRQSGKILSAEWKRLTQEAEIAWGSARDREAAVGKTETAGDLKARAALYEAREAVRETEAAVRRFQTSLDVTAKDLRFRVIAPAAVPATPEGLPNVIRIGLVVLLGFATTAGLLIRPLRRGAAPREDAPDAAAATEAADDGLGAPPIMSEASLATVLKPVLEPVAESTAAASRANPVADPLEWPRQTMRPSRLRDMPRVAKPAAWAKSTPFPPPADAKQARTALISTLDEIVPTLAGLMPKAGSPRLVFVGSLDSAAATGPVALALARTACAAGLRVLLIEGERPRPFLAAAIRSVASPVLIDVLGTLRIGLRVEPDAAFFIAPIVPNAKRLVAGLSRRDDMTFIDDPAAVFDLAIVDGGHVVPGTAEDWSEIAAASLRVGRHVSRDDDGRFLDAIGGTAATFLGTIAASAASATDDSAEPEPLLEAPGPSVRGGSGSARPSNVARPLFAVQTMRDEDAGRHDATRRPLARRRVGTR